MDPEAMVESDGRQSASPTTNPTRSVLVHLHPKSALTSPEPTPAYAVVRNAELLHDVLQDAGIPHFAIRSTASFRVCIGVSSADRARVYQALVGSHLKSATYVRAIEPKDLSNTTSLPVGSKKARSKIESSKIIRVIWYHALPQNDSNYFCGEEFSCEIEFWSSSDGREGDWDDEASQKHLLAPRLNLVTRAITEVGDLDHLPVSRFSRLLDQTEDQGDLLPTRQQLAKPVINDVRFPIDVVYTWVDGHDPRWIELRSAAKGEDLHEESASLSRFLDRAELKYSLRSLYANAPWINHIYIVTAGQRPSWLESDVEGLTVIDHRDIFSDAKHLPTFNSHSIESQLHHIPGLSEHFIYLNDDMFIGRPILPTQFFTSNGLSKFFLSPSRVNQWSTSRTDTPVDQATKNGRRLIERDFGVTISHVMEHAPYALRTSVLHEAEARYQREFERTAASTFRSADDLNVPSNFAHYYGHLTQRAVPSSIRFSYIGLSVSDLAQRLDRLVNLRDRDAFCINDTSTEEGDIESQLETIIPFFETYFPIASPWEAGAGR